MVPQLPDPDRPDLKNWLPFVLKQEVFNPETIIIGHSSGSAFILALLEKTPAKIKKAVLVSGFSTSLDGKPDAILKPKYDWAKIKSNSAEFIFINSDNDPWGCNDKQGLAMWQKLGGTLILRHGEGHMGSVKFHQPYKQFPLLLKLIVD